MPPGGQTSGSSSKRPRTSAFKPPRPSNSSLARGNVTAAREDEEEPAQPTTSEDSPGIPSELLTRLLHEFFKDEKTKMSNDANSLVAKYMETFVKEAIARAVIERNESNDSSDKFLEVWSNSIIWRSIILQYFGRLWMMAGALIRSGLTCYSLFE